MSTSEPVRVARRGGEDVARAPQFEWLARAGLVARGVIYAIIAVIAVGVAFEGGHGRPEDQQGALREIAGAPFGKVLLIAVAVGLAGYATWRLVRAALGHGPEQHDDTKDRIGGLFSGVAYGVLCVAAVGILLHSGSQSSAKEATGGVLGWTGGTWIVGLAGVVMAIVALDQAYKGITMSFLENSKTEQMRERTQQAFAAIGVFGHLARAVVFGLVAYGLIKAAIAFDPDEAIGLDGALARLAHADYGPVLLGAVAFGLLGFGLYSVLDARFRRV